MSYSMHRFKKLNAHTRAERDAQERTETHEMGWDKNEHPSKQSRTD